MVHRGRVVYVSAPSGGGKTTLAAGLKASHGFLQFEVDGWLHCGDPFFDATGADLALVEQKRAARSAKFAEAVNDAMACYMRMISGEKDFDTPVVDELFAMLGADIKRTLAEFPDRDMVLAGAVYTKRQRDLVRMHVPEVEFVLIEPEPSLLRDRIMKRTVQQAEKSGKTLDADELTLFEETWVSKSAVGWESNDGTEARTVTIDVTAAMTKEDVQSKAEALLGLRSS